MLVVAEFGYPPLAVVGLRASWWERTCNFLVYLEDFELGFWRWVLDLEVFTAS